jgi:hypothetical protein
MDTSRGQRRSRAGGYEVSINTRRRTKSQALRFGPSSMVPPQYRLTPSGRQRLNAERSKWEQLAAAVNRVMRPA